MKISIAFCVLFLSFISFSQNLIGDLTGSYKVDLKATMPFFDKIAYTESGELPDDVRARIEKISLIIYTDSLSLYMNEYTQTLPFTAQTSSQEKGHCDLHLDMTEMTVPEEAQDMFLTVYLKQKNRLQIVSSLGPKELNNYIWFKDN